MALKLAVLISGRGGNLAAIAGAIDATSCNARIQLVVSDSASAAGLDFARQRGLSSAVVQLQDQPNRAAWDRALAETVAAAAPDLVVLAGFMRILGGAFLTRFPRRVINVHPALLPLFPGMDGPAQAIAAGVRVSGCSVHLVDSGVDTGPILAQAVVPVLPHDDATSLHARIQLQEHTLLPAVIDAIARGTIVLEPRLQIRETPDARAMLASLLPRATGDGSR
jgi:phosphoribosylglycinamide formyltransferase 1